MSKKRGAAAANVGGGEERSVKNRNVAVSSGLVSRALFPASSASATVRMPVHVLSLFDGMSGAQMALRRARIAYDTYYASEIDATAISVTQRNFPQTIQLGSVERVNREYFGDKRITLLVGGSPCQSFSTAGPMTGFDGKSGLFWQYVRVLRELQPTYFLLENVVMKQEWQDAISEALGVQPILIDSNLVSAQNRRRLYWTNILNVALPADRNVLLKDVLEPATVNVDRFLLSASKIDRCLNAQRGRGFFYTPQHAKIGTLLAGYYKLPTDGTYVEDWNGKRRKLTPRECERLQTVPEGYTASVADSHRYKMLGNGFTVDVIAHILSSIPPLA